MKTIAKLTLVLFVLATFQNCSKDDAPTPDPIAQPEPEPVPENQAPTQVSLLSPAVDAENIDVLPTFSWEAATDPDGDAITYEIYADATANPTNLIGVTTDTSFELEECLSLLENYNWKVIAKDGNGGESESNNQTFNTRTVRTSIATNSAAFGERGAHSTVVFNDKVWVIGGRVGNGSTMDTNDVWNSEDGVNWNIVTANANFAPRYRHSSVVFDNKIWVLGGVIGSELTNEIWNSNDGINWTFIGDNTFLDFRDNNVIVFDNKLWLVDNAVWFSEDGVVWTLAYSGSVNIQGAAVTYQDKIIVTNIDDSQVHISEDGINWETLDNNINTLLEDTSSINEEMVVFNNKIWSLGQYDNKIIYTSDGINWSLANELSVLPYLGSHTIEEKNNKLWVIGGYTFGSNNSQDSVYFID